VLDLKEASAIGESDMQSVIQSAFDRAFGNGENPGARGAPGVQGRIEEAGTVDWEAKASEEFDIQLHKARIMVIGCGGGGSNTVTRLCEMGAHGSDIIALNTDAKHLSITKAHKKLLIGKDTTRGLGAGGYPQVGEKAATENRTQIKQLLEGADLVFVTAGLGGGTGTGSAPVVAEIAKSMGAIVVGAVTMPFKMEGTRIQKAEDGLSKLRQVTDTVVVIENQKLLEYAGSMPLAQAFALADELISMMIKGIVETITVPSLVNLDFADVRTIMRCGGVSAICVGESDSQARVKDAVLKALNHPLLEVDYNGALGALIHVICGPDATLAEINEAGELISKRLSPEAQVIWGARVVPEYAGKVQVIAIVTGVKSPYLLGPVERAEAARAAENELGIPVIMR
jgi:cell division protein FtsZ